MKTRLLKTTRALFLSTLALLLSALTVSAQNAGVKGVVKDASGNALSGATIKIDRKSALSDNDGNYSVRLNAGRYQLSVSFVGKIPQTIPVVITGNNTEELNVTLLDASISQEEVVVVGSRNPKRTATDAAVPIDVIPLKSLANEVGQLDLTQLLTYLAPTFNSVRQTIGDGTDHIDPAQLRGLGPDQVLVLVNGKRYHQSSLVNVNGTVNRGTVGTDLNSIPASSIERIEILRDGAAAQFGVSPY